MKHLFEEDCALTDSLGRALSYLRISLTDKCNFKCSYCYGPGVEKSHVEQLTDTELKVIIKSFSLLGFDKMRLTGGEPLLRRNIVDLVQFISSLPESKVVGITTNGSLLKRKLNDLINAGLNRLNISIDSLDRNTFHRITGRDELGTVLEAVDAALQYEVFPWIKVNMVVMRGVNDNEISEFVKWTLPRKVDLRFIEYMPTDKTNWGSERFLSETHIREKVGVDLKRDENVLDISGPAVRYMVDGYPGRISFISAMSHEFCRACNRVRLTSSGDLLGCLFRAESVSLVEMVRNGSSAADIASYIREVVRDGKMRKIPCDKGKDFKPVMSYVGG
jgi:molybdenum cofactor biosynthesis protein A